MARILLGVTGGISAYKAVELVRLATRAGHAPISHLELVRRADVYAIVPASANTIAKLATGMADNLLTSAALASAAPLVVAPAMNDRMWAHAATRANVETLAARGATLVPPATGE